MLATVAAVAIGAAACSDTTSAGPPDTSPTFERATGDAVAFEKPVANVNDLIGPVGEDDPWTIVGTVFDPDSRASVAAVWTSPDASDWERETVSPASPGTGESMAAGVVTDDGLLAVGQVGDGAEADAAVWRQVDGDWRRTTPAVMGGDHEQWAFDVTTGEGGTLVAGGENVWGEVRPRLWLSTDGETWSEVDGGAGGPLDATGEESIRDIAAVGSGFVAVGSRTVENEQDGVAWFSPDGTSWEQLDAPTLAGDGRQEVQSVVAAEGVVVAGGYVENASGQGVPAVWRSADGRTWGDPNVALPMPDSRGTPRDLPVRSITVGDQGLVAAGGNQVRPRVWRSTDAGVTWKELPDLIHGELFQDGVDLRDAVGARGVTVGLGTEPSVLLLAGARWQDATGDTFPKGGEQPFATSAAATDETEIVGGGTYVAPSGHSRERYTGRLWSRGDDGWSEVDGEALTDGHIMDLTAFPGGFAAVGFEDFGLAAKRETLGSADPLPDGLVWVSPNGTDWARIGLADVRINEQSLEFLEDPSADGLAELIALMEQEAPPESVAPAGGDGTRSLSAVAGLGDGFIAVGSVYDGDDADPIVVVSPEGLSVTAETPPHGGRGIQSYNDVCVGPDGVTLAVGETGTNGAFDAAVARRNDAGTWGAAESESFAGGGSQEALACAAGDDGFIVVGSDDSSGNDDARIWTSSDGVTWTDVASSILGGSGDQRATAVAAAPDGGWLVAGVDTAAGDADVALWRVSGSGEVTRRDEGETALGGPGTQVADSVLIDADGHVTVVGDDYGRVGLWESDTVDR